MNESENPKRIKSHWIKFGNTGSEYSDRWQCDNCKKTVRTETWGTKCEYPLCPYCGADMSGGADDECYCFKG